MSTKGASSTDIAIHIVLALCCLVILFPILWMVSTSLRLPAEVYTRELRIFPHHPTLANYQIVWSIYPLLAWVRNTAITSVGITVSQILLALLAAYAFARYRFPGKELLFYAVVATPLIPFMVVLIPNFILMSRLGLLDNLMGVIFPYMRAGLATFLLRQFIRLLPTEYYDSAEMDGANSWTVLWHIVVPNLKSGLVVATLMVFINEGWNIYFWPLLVLRSTELQTIAIGLRQFMDADYGYQWGELMAAASYATIIPLVFFFVAQRWVISAFVTSGVKN